MLAYPNGEFTIPDVPARSSGLVWFLLAFAAVYVVRFAAIASGL